MGWYFYERCLPFGLKPAPGIFELFSSAINEFILHAGVLFFFHYLDDFLLLTNQERSSREYQLILSLFQTLGVPLSSNKLAPPCTQIEFLGIIIDTDTMEFRLPTEKLLEYRAILSRWIAKPQGTIHELQSLVGILVYAARIIQHGNTFYHHILRHLRTHRMQPFSSLPPTKPQHSCDRPAWAISEEDHIMFRARTSSITRAAMPLVSAGVPVPPSTQTNGSCNDTANHKSPLSRTESSITPPSLSLVEKRAPNPLFSQPADPRDDGVSHNSSPFRKESFGSHNRIISLDREAQDELNWWYHFIHVWNGISIIEPSLEIYPLNRRHTLHTEACKTGMDPWSHLHHSQYMHGTPVNWKQLSVHAASLCPTLSCFPSFTRSILGKHSSLEAQSTYKPTAKLSFMASITASPAIPASTSSYASCSISPL